MDNSYRDAQRFQSLLVREGVEVKICLSGAEAERSLTDTQEGFAAAVILWDLAGTISGADLMMQCRRLWSDMPIVVTSESLDASMAARAYAFGARDFLEKPLDSERIVSCLRSLLSEQDPYSPLIYELRKKILGESSAILATLKQVAKVIPYGDSRVLLMGESGTGKELFAKAIHELGPRKLKPCVDVNLSGLPPTLIESNLFGHEKGAFTGAHDRHVGFIEEAGEGTIFLDEIGELELSLQTKLLRVIQEKKFRRLNGKEDLVFKARLVCATNRDLVAAVNQSSFRRDLFHRIAEVAIQIPPLRERRGDLDLLLHHFLDKYRGNRNVKFARESLVIMRSYPFDGNVRELENVVKSALIQSEDAEVILPQHLPLTNMGNLISAHKDPNASETANNDHEQRDPLLRTLIDELTQMLAHNWPDLGYREAVQRYIQAFDRVYFRRQLNRSHHNVSQAARAAEIDTKTFRRRWKECGLPPLSGGEEDEDE